jgi:hypothetical protein
MNVAKLSTPLKIGLFFGLIGIALTIVGIVRGTVPPNPASILVALLIGGGVWFVVSWAVATAAVDVEQDLVEAQDEAVAEKAS